MGVSLLILEDKISGFMALENHSTWLAVESDCAVIYIHSNVFKIKMENLKFSSNVTCFLLYQFKSLLKIKNLNSLSPQSHKWENRDDGLYFNNMPKIRY